MIVRKNKKIFIILIFIFGLPLIAAQFLYNYHDKFHYQTNNRGNFLKPPLFIKELTTSDRNPLWQMLYVINQDCDESCANNLYKMRQIRLALNQDQNKARGIIFLQTEVSHPALDAYLKKDYSMIQFMMQIDGTHLAENHLYLADPKGNVILSYTDKTNPKDILKDLKHLIKVNNP